ncbi:MAG: restriction endonuclease [Thermoplasmata archaeon]|nr:restriction endonuclease [Thermoplasmata archaeon]
MNYNKFCTILNKHIFEGEKKELLRKLAERPERFVGLFRPTKPGAKVLQHLLQSHEIRFGDAMEELISEFLKDWGFKVLPKIIIPDPSNPRKKLDIDQYFTDNKMHFFIEQKVRDDHDSTKKRGQINNFETKLEFLYRKHGQNLIGIMYFIDPDLVKNKNYYIEELNKMADTYGVSLHLLYGQELFEFFNELSVWNDLLSWLSKWKESLPELPEINFDSNPQDSFNEIKDLEIRFWRKILENEKLWRDGIMLTIFRNGATLRMLFDFFSKKPERAYRKLAEMIEQKLKEYYDCN